MAEQNKIEVVLALLDKATAPFVAFNRRLETMQAPVKKLSNKFALLVKESGMDKVSEAVGGVATAFGGVLSEVGALAAKITAGVGIVGGALFGLVKMTSNAGDSFDELSTKAGVSAGFFQQAAYAASFASVETGSLASAMGKMNANIVAANTGGQEMQVWFKRAGIGAAELKKMKPEEVFNRVMEKVKEFPKESAKAGAMMKAIFGKSGGDLLPMVESFKELSKEAVDLGLILSDDTVKAGADFNDSFDKMMKVIKGVGMMIGGMLMPYFKEATDAITAFVMANREMIRVKIAEWIENARAAWPGFRDGVLEAWAAIKKFIADATGWIESIGGFKSVLLIVAAVISGPLILAILALGQAFLALGIAIMTTPVGWIIAGIAAIIAVGALMYSSFSDMGGAMSGTFSALGEVFGTLFETLKEYFAMWMPLVLPVLKAIGYIIGAVILVAVMALVGALKTLMFFLKPVLDGLGKLFEFGGNIVTKIFGNSATPPVAAAGAPGGPPGDQTTLPGFRLAPPAGFAPAAANYGGRGIVESTQTNNAKIEVDFKNLPKGVNVRPVGGSAPIDFNMGYANATF